MAKLISGFGKKARQHVKRKSSRGDGHHNSASENAHAPLAQNLPRTQTITLQSARGRKLSSTLWLTRHLNDPYVQQAQQQGFRSRAAFKLLQINDSFSLFTDAHSIVDLGAAPGGWMQVARNMACDDAVIVGCDILAIDPIAGTEFICGDFTDNAVQTRIMDCLAGKKIDLLLSDISPNMIGHKKTDFDRISLMLETSFQFAKRNLKMGGNFIAKTRQSGTENALLQQINRHFAKTKHFKPDASRKDTSEFYLIACGFTP